nr:MAG TPA: hypothetical protein [Crassvirales sp.]
MSLRGLKWLILRTYAAFKSSDNTSDSITLNLVNLAICYCCTRYLIN